MIKEIYLDNAATTKPKEEVINAIIPYLTDRWYNPSSLYGKAQNIKKDIENARKIVGKFINAKSEEIFFTSSGSESNCWAIQGFTNYCHSVKKNPIIISSVIEHKSIISCIENINVDCKLINVDKYGFIDFETLENRLKENANDNNKILVSIQFANNEIGTIQNVKEISELAHKHNAFFHTDAVQAFGQIPINVTEMGIDLMSASGHKIGTPKGIGVLYKKDNVILNPIIYGSQMDGLRGGTENVPYIIGMAKAIELCKTDIGTLIAKRHIRDYFMRKLQSELNCTVNGSFEEYRLPNNINVTFKDKINGESLIYVLDTAGVNISSGSACNSHSNKPSYVLKAIGLSDEDAAKTIRISLPEQISKDEIDYTVEEIKKSIKLFF